MKGERGRNGEQEQVDLKTLLVERSTQERNMRAKTNTGSQNAFKREQSSTSAVNLGGNSEIKPTSNTLFDFYRIIGVLTVLVENVSSTETVPTRGPAPKINPTENNALLDSAEKVKAKVECEISLPKA